METGKIFSIEHPNTGAPDERGYYSINDKLKYAKKCDEIQRIEKAGEMAMVGWLQVIVNGEVIAEIKESVCDIYYA
jgi:hypothetical protein